MKKTSNTERNQTRAARIIPIHRNDRCWFDIPVDISRSVAERLIYPDFLRFRAVCKSWQRAFSDDDDVQRRAVFALVRVDSSHHVPHNRTKIIKKTVCTSRFFDLLPPLQDFPVRNFPIRCVVEEEQEQEDYPLVHPSFCCSHSGWLLLLKSPTDYDLYNNKAMKKTFYVHNPLQNDTMELGLPPKGDLYYQYRVVEVAGFSTDPTSRDCEIFLLWKHRRQLGYDSDPQQREWDEFHITTYHRKHRSWSVVDLPLKNPNNKDWKFIKDVAYVDGIFYCAVDMGSKVILGTYNVELQKWNTMRKRCLRLTSRPEWMNLVKSDEGLLLAVLYKEQFIDELVYHIYQFDLTREEWTRVNRLGNRVLMLRNCASVTTPAVEVISRLANMVFVSIPFSEGYLAFTWETEGEWRWRQACN